MNKAWSPTVGGVSNSRPPAGSGCLGTVINSEMGTEIGGPGDCFSGTASVSDAVLGASFTRTTETISNGETLKCTRQF